MSKCAEPLQPEYAEWVKHRVYLHSASGMWTYYEGHVDLWAPPGTDRQEIFRRAVCTLTRTSFPDRRGLDSWVLERVELWPFFTSLENE